MTGFKLTEEQIDEIYENWYVQQCEGKGNTCCDFAAKAQRKAIVEWLDSDCTGHEHSYGYVKRWHCALCRQQLREEVE